MRAVNPSHAAVFRGMIRGQMIETQADLGF